MIKQRILKSGRGLGLAALGVLLAALLLPAWAQADSSSLPPRPPTPTAAPIPGVSGGTIELQAARPQVGAWTVIEWQDASGGWHTVTGWQGSFDSISSSTGLKTWWVAPNDLGKGPFRWRVYQGIGGKLLATSASFDLPAANRIIVTVGVTLAP